MLESRTLCLRTFKVIYTKICRTNFIYCKNKVTEKSKVFIDTFIKGKEIASMYVYAPVVGLSEDDGRVFIRTDQGYIIICMILSEK